MKSIFFKFNAKLAFMSLALIGLLAGCNKDDNDAPNPEQEKPTYEVQATITDASTTKALQGATVKVGDKTATTDANGKCTVEAVAGKNTVTISKDKYQTYTEEVNIAEVTTGKGTGLVKVALKPGSNDPTYKKVQYDIKATVSDNADGKAVTISGVYCPSISTTKISTSGNIITVTDLKPGSYTLTVNANGYSAATSEIVITEIKGEEGPETETQIYIKEATIKMSKKEVTTPTYSISGTTTDQTGKSLSGILIEASIGGAVIGSQTSKSDGSYSFEIPADKIIEGGSLVTLKVAETDKYMAAVATGKLFIIKTGTSKVDANLTLTPKEVKVEEDGTQAGTGNLEIPVENTQVGEIESATPETSTSKEEISKVLTEQLKEVASVTPEEIEAVSAIIEQMQKDNKIENVSKVAVVPMVQEAKMTVTSKVTETPEAGGSESGIKEQKDEVTIPQGSVVVFPTGTAQNITVTRDLATEKAAGSERVFVGSPSGATFTKPMLIQFETPIATDAIQFSILYYDEASSTWKADAGNYASFKNGKFEGNIKHFSKIKFGFETATEQDGTGKIEKYLVSPNFTGSTSATVQVTLKSALTGSKFANGTIEETVKAALPEVSDEKTIAYIVSALKELVLAGNGNILPGTDFETVEFKTNITIPAYRQVEGFNVIYATETTNYAITVINKSGSKITIVVPVTKVTGVSIAAKETPNHGHGHGTGSNLNSGGGIIDFE